MQTTEVTLELARTKDYVEGYANQVLIRVGVMDFQLQFGIEEPKAQQVVGIRVSQAISLSPQAAKALLANLQQQILNYESTYGRIQGPPMGHAGIPIKS